MTEAAIRDLVSLDIKYNQTPDMSSLRFYGGGIPVFFWDDLQQDQTLYQTLGFKGKTDGYSHIRNYFGSCRTAEAFVPWYNLSDDSDAYPAYCIEDPDDISMMEIEDYCESVRRPMSGTIKLLDLKALADLDIYYMNGEIFERRLIDIYLSPAATKAVKVWAYLNTVDGIATYSKDHGCYVFDEGIDVMNFTLRGEGVKQYYEM